MLHNKLFQDFVSNVPTEVREEITLNIEIANRISDILKERKLSQKDFAQMMGKRPSEISKWLSGTHGFTTATLAKIRETLGDPIVEVNPVETAPLAIRIKDNKRKVKTKELWIYA